MKIIDVMTRTVKTIMLDTPLRDAAEQMRAQDIGALPVTDGEKIKGILTDRDIVIRAVAAGKDLSRTMAKDAMSKHIRYVFEDEDIKTSAESMSTNQIRRLVVLDRNKRLVGLVSLGDLSRKGEDEHLLAGVARCCSESAAQHAAH